MYKKTTTNCHPTITLYAIYDPYTHGDKLEMMMTFTLYSSCAYYGANRSVYLCAEGPVVPGR